MSHSTERWKQDGTNIYIGEGRVPQDVLGMIHNPGLCKRAVSCFNACAGTPNPAAIPMCITSLREMVKLMHDGDEHGYMSQWYQEAVAALDELEKENP